MAINFNQTTDAMLLQLINDANADYMTQPLTFDEVEFSSPTVSSEGTRDTQVTVTAKPLSGIQGSLPVYFNRLDLDVFFPTGISLTIAQGDDLPETVHDLLVKINDGYQLQFSPYDISNEVIVNPNDPVDFVASGDSYVWLGQTQIELNIELVQLSSLIQVTILPGFEYPDPEPEPEP